MSDKCEFRREVGGAAGRDPLLPPRHVEHEGGNGIEKPHVEVISIIIN